jgi:hypothetical protein
MYRTQEFQTIGLLALGLAAISAIARGFWLYRASLTWPTADGVITRIDIERRWDASIHGGHYFCATFSYDFRNPAANRLYGSWYKNFSSDEEARQLSRTSGVKEKRKSPGLLAALSHSRHYARRYPARCVKRIE